ncbi:hypothetical protein ERO13_D01G192700v2 [Gossypium hirsutum]|uniref:Transcription repressor n=1 Tax=Gossypium hirsutum TaxID=3635 RepID=A0A1U8LNS5_GOSHI|nr:transcription repressor OFP15-like [Gossypium hirsutum]KAG4163750.1 hypothetical protein ERO13_D01G192700v2 [Gossypium hirsutum]
MGKKIKFPFLSNAKNNIVRQPKSSWQWPSCHQPRTLSFRTDNNTTLFKNINSAYLDAITIADENETPPSDDCLETVIRGLRSDRLFFKPGETSSIMEEATKPSEEEEEEEEEEEDGLPFKESVVLSMESRDPYVDFRESMEEMVEAQGLNDWEELEQLLCWYLKANGKCNHGFIIGAFIDLLVGKLTIVSSNPKSDNCSPSSPLSFYTSSSSSSSSSSSEDCSSATINEAVKEIDDNSCHCLFEADNKKEMIIIEGNEEDDASSLLDVCDSSY